MEYKQKGQNRMGFISLSVSSFIGTGIMRSSIGSWGVLEVGAIFSDRGSAELEGTFICLIFSDTIPMILA